MNKIKIIDLETESAPRNELFGVMPTFKAPSGTKDPAKIAANVAGQQAKWMEKGALSPTTGRLLSVAVCDADDIGTFKEKGQCGAIPYDEARLVDYALSVFQGAIMGSQYTVSGFYIKAFDLPFIIRRAWVLGVPVPSSLIPTGKTRFYWPSWIIDMVDIWGLGEFKPSGSLDTIGKHLGIGAKTGNGADFAKLYRNPDTYDKAIEYQRSEMAICCGMAQLFGLIGGDR